MAVSTIDTLIQEMGRMPVEIPHGKPGSQLKVIGGRPIRTDLQSEIGRLNLVVEALVRLVLNKGLADSTELADLLSEIDLENGTADGQLNTTHSAVPEWCKKCEARIPPGWTSCSFCGEAFDQVPTRLADLETDSSPSQKQLQKFPEWCPDCDARIVEGQSSCRFCGVKLHPVD
ncbi:MAG: hypothetical protein VB858_04950 [Planctomycetaceae bacterium]